MVSAADAYRSEPGSNACSSIESYSASNNDASIEALQKRAGRIVVRCCVEQSPSTATRSVCVHRDESSFLASLTKAKKSNGADECRDTRRALSESDDGS